MHSAWVTGAQLLPLLQAESAEDSEDWEDGLGDLEDGRGASSSVQDATSSERHVAEVVEGAATSARVPSRKALPVR